ncbi:unnamed protein product [Peniophora sp. CBMAI 1063]|nr:unnamed protein product [Peniophora sp. CBMAI 1063]
MDATTVEAQIQEATEAMQAQNTNLLNLKRQHNDIVPIGRLPDEVLETLFLWLRNACVEEEVLLVAYPALRAPGWAPVSWVCHRFRTLCLGYPLLWNHIGDYRHKWMFTCVERSTPSPLDVHLNIDLHGKYPLKRILQSVFRMRALVLEGEAQTMRDRVLPRLNIPALELATLSLRTHGHILGIHSVGILTAIRHLDEAFSGQVPHLRSLEIGRTMHLYPSSSLLSPLLQQLVLEDAYSAAELFNLLRVLPGLRSLEVTSANVGVLQTQARVFDTADTVDLPVLHSLSIEIAFTEEVVRLLQVVKVPQLSSTSLVFTSFNFDPERCGTALTAISSLLQQNDDGTSFRSLRLHPISRYVDGYRVCERVLLWHSPGAGTESQKHHFHQSPAYIEFKPSSALPVTPVHALVPFYRHVCSDLPLAGLTTVTIEMDYVFTTREWADILRPLARIDHLKLIGDRLGTVLDALALTPFILPMLSHLSVCIPLRRTVTPPPLLRELMDAAKARIIERRLHVAFEDCDRFVPALYEGLGEFADVTWDDMGFFDDDVQDQEPWLALLFD